MDLLQYVSLEFPCIMLLPVTVLHTFNMWTRFSPAASFTAARALCRTSPGLPLSTPEGTEICITYIHPVSASAIVILKVNDKGGEKVNITKFLWRGGGCIEISVLTDVQISEEFLNYPRYLLFVILAVDKINQDKKD